MIRLFNKAPTVARNTHVVEVAKRSLVAASHIIQQQNHNSVQVAGFPIVIYQRMSGGVSCSCSAMETAAPTFSTNNAYNERGEANSRLITALEQQSEFGIADYHNERTPEINLPTLDQQGAGEDYVIQSGQALEDFAIDEVSLSAFGNSACPICHGSGYKGGYNFMQGSRLVLDHSDIFDGSCVEIDRDVRPYRIKVLPGGGEITFKLSSVSPNVPTAIFLWDGFNRVYPIQGSDVVSLVAPDGSLFTGNGALAQYGVYKLDLSGFPEGFTFTHVEVLQLLVKTPVLADFPLLTAGFDPARVNTYSATTVNLSPNLPRLKPKDVIVDLTYGIRWYVTAVTHLANPTTGGQTWQQSVECRPIEPHEPTSSLLLPYGFVPSTAAGVHQHNFNRVHRGGF